VSNATPRLGASVPVLWLLQADRILRRAIGTLPCVWVHMSPGATKSTQPYPTSNRLVACSDPQCRPARQWVAMLVPRAPGSTCPMRVACLRFASHYAAIPISTQNTPRSQSRRRSRLICRLWNCVNSIRRWPHTTGGQWHQIHQRRRQDGQSERPRGRGLSRERRGRPGGSGSRPRHRPTSSGGFSRSTGRRKSSRVWASDWPLHRRPSACTAA
jgi:hypothetical protein